MGIKRSLLSRLSSSLPSLLLFLLPVQSGFAAADDFMRRTDPTTFPVVFDMDLQCPLSRGDLAKRISETLDESALSSNTEPWSRDEGGFFLNLDCSPVDEILTGNWITLHAALAWSYPERIHGIDVYPDIEIDTLTLTVDDGSEQMLDAVIDLFRAGLSRYLAANNLL